MKSDSNDRTFEKPVSSRDVNQLKY